MVGKVRALAAVGSGIACCAAVFALSCSLSRQGEGPTSLDSSTADSPEERVVSEAGAEAMSDAPGDGVGGGDVQEEVGSTCPLACTNAGGVCEGDAGQCSILLRRSDLMPVGAVSARCSLLRRLHGSPSVQRRRRLLPIERVHGCLRRQCYMRRHHLWRRRLQGPLRDLWKLHGRDRLQGDEHMPGRVYRARHVLGRHQQHRAEYDSPVQSTEYVFAEHLVHRNYVPGRLHRRWLVRRG